MNERIQLFPIHYTVEPLIAATFTAKVRWALMEVAAIQRFTTNFRCVRTQISKECLFSCLKKVRACDRNPV